MLFERYRHPAPCLVELATCSKYFTQARSRPEGISVNIILLRWSVLTFHNECDSILPEPRVHVQLFGPPPSALSCDPTAPSAGGSQGGDQRGISAPT
jgi:hypothetical protein